MKEIKTSDLKFIKKTLNVSLRFSDNIDLKKAIKIIEKILNKNNNIYTIYE